LAITADIVAAFVSNNSVPPSELPSLLVQVHGAFDKSSDVFSSIVICSLQKQHNHDSLRSATQPRCHSFVSLSATPAAEAGSEIEKLTPAQIKKSITPDALIFLRWFPRPSCLASAERVAE
jgi:predicted transcriptional regulator